MSYPFDPHNTSSQNSRNQFMMQDQLMSMSSNNINANNNAVPKDMQKLFSYMKNVMSNPMLMDEMEKFLSVKESQKNSSFVSRQNQSLSISIMESHMRQPPDSYLIQTSQLQRPQPLRMGPKQQVKQFKTSQIAVNNIALKKGSNVPSPYVAKQIIENNSASQSNYSQSDKFSKFQSRPNNFQQPRNKIEQKSQPLKTTVSFEDIPIKSNYIAGQQYGNFDSGLQRFAEYPENESQSYENNTRKVVKQAILKNKSKTYSNNQNTLSNNSNTFSNKYIEAEQRPINGTNKDFKQLLKEKSLESPFDDRPLPTISNNQKNNWAKEEYDEQANQEQNNEERKPKKQFLKRGSRQYLSSAKDKKSVIKPVKQNKNKEIQQTLNSSRFGGQKQRDKTPTKRDVSQNRILSKRNTVNNDKSVSKLRSRDNLNTSNNESFYQQKQEENSKRSITPKNEIPLPKSKSPILPPKNNKITNNLGKTNASISRNQGSGKKKNVFDDSSSSGQESHQAQNQNEDEEEYESVRTNKLMENKKANQSGEKSNIYQPDKEFNMFSRQKKEEVIDGVYLTKSQLDTILQKYAPKATISTKDVNASEQKFNQLRKKYTDLCNLVEKQKIQHQEQMEKQREQFENFKQQEIQKLKNQKRVMERQVKSSMPSQSQNLQKDKEQVQNLKKELEKEKQEHKKKEKNNKILIEKYKKQNEELKFRLQKLQEQVQKVSSSYLNKNFSSAGPQRQTLSSTNLKPNTANDKSRSKAVAKDVSPGKNKTSKSSKVIQQNVEEEPAQDKNYKKTVPLYKGQQKKSISPSINQNNKKNISLKNFDSDPNSEDQSLPTFKMDNKKNEQTKVRTQKKYQYVENSVQNNQHIKQNQSTHNRKNSGHQSKTNAKNVFADDSDQQHEENEQNQEEFDQQTDQHSGFFKAHQKYQSLSDLMAKNFSIKNITSQMIESFRYQNNAEYCRYISRINNPKRIIVNSSKNGVDKKITNIYNDKSKQILFQNGVKKQIFEDGYTIIYFKNGDIKQKLTDGTILYYFQEKKVDQITLINGLNVYRFDNNQVELHFNGGKYIEIRHPDGTIKMLGSLIN